MPQQKIGIAHKNEKSPKSGKQIGFVIYLLYISYYFCNTTLDDMKYLLSIIMLLAVSASVNRAEEPQNTDVFICTDATAKSYHRTDKCRALEQCSLEVKKIKLSEAETLGKRKCQICYKD